MILAINLRFYQLYDSILACKLAFNSAVTIELSFVEASQNNFLLNFRKNSQEQSK